MTREEAVKRFQRMKKILSIPNSDAARTIEAIDMAIEALQQQTCDKCKFNEETDGMNCYECVKGISDNFEALEQQPKRGKWKNVRENNVGDCSECECRGRAWMSYCWNCGARMESE